MTHTFKIKETPKSKSLIEHLQTLTYVEHVDPKTPKGALTARPERKVLTEAEIVAKVKKAEKGNKIPYAEFKKITETW